jgi:hypothetical protein
VKIYRWDNPHDSVICTLESFSLLHSSLWSGAFCWKDTRTWLGTYTHRQQNLLILQLIVSSSHRNVVGQQARSLQNLHQYTQFFFNNSSPVKGWDQFSNFAVSSFAGPRSDVYFPLQAQQGLCLPVIISKYLHQLQHSITAENETDITGRLGSGKTQYYSVVGLITADSHNEVM